MVVNGEARGEPFYGQVAVATVVLNRAEANKTSACYEGITRKRQFAPLAHPTKSSWLASYVAYYYRVFLPQALKENWYFSSSKDSKHYGTYNMKIGRHTFYAK
jgi:hypothetical protein